MKIDSNIERYLKLAFLDSNFIELSHQTSCGLRKYKFDKPEKLLHKASELSEVGNLFTSLNRVETLPLGNFRNDCFRQYSRLFFDFDPQRPKGVSSTWKELLAAKESARKLKFELDGFGWPEPAIALSGNGYHLLYRCALPNTPETVELLDLIYSGLHYDHSTPLVEFDRVVRNPSRLCTLYGSKKRKGPDTPDRPHRYSSVQVPMHWHQVSLGQVQALANRYAEKKQNVIILPKSRNSICTFGEGDYSTLDVVSWFQFLGLYDHYIHGNMHAVNCPWQHEHTTESPDNHSDCIIFEADGGWPGFHCKHGHCDRRNIRNVIDLLGTADQFCARKFRMNH